MCYFKTIRCIELVMLFFSLQVLPKVSLSGPSHPIIEGDNVTLTCNIIDGVPKPGQIRWLRDRVLLDENNRNMVLRSIKKEQEGNYICETSNAGGSAKDSIEVIVDGKPFLSSVDMNETWFIERNT